MDEREVGEGLVVGLGYAVLLCACAFAGFTAVLILLAILKAVVGA
jgi:hypothetical protein